MTWYVWYVAIHVSLYGSMGSRISAARHAGEDLEEWIRREHRSLFQHAGFLGFRFAARISPPRTEKMPPAGPESMDSSSEESSPAGGAPAATPLNRLRAGMHPWMLSWVHQRGGTQRVVGMETMSQGGARTQNSPRGRAGTRGRKVAGSSASFAGGH